MRFHQTLQFVARQCTGIGDTDWIRRAWYKDFYEPLCRQGWMLPAAIACQLRCAAEMEWNVERLRQGQRADSQVANQLAMWRNILECEHRTTRQVQQRAQSQQVDRLDVARRIATVVAGTLMSRYDFSELRERGAFSAAALARWEAARLAAVARRQGGHLVRPELEAELDRWMREPAPPQVLRLATEHAYRQLEKDEGRALVSIAERLSARAGLSVDPFVAAAVEAVEFPPEDPPDAVRGALPDADQQSQRLTQIGEFVTRAQRSLPERLDQLAHTELFLLTRPDLLPVFISRANEAALLQSVCDDQMQGRNRPELHLQLEIRDEPGGVAHRLSSATEAPVIAWYRATAVFVSFIVARRLALRRSLLSVAFGWRQGDEESLVELSPEATPELGDSPLSALRSLTSCCPEAFSTAPFAAVPRRRAATSRLRPVDQWMRVLLGPGRYGDDSHHVRSTRQRSVRLVRQPDSTCHVEFFDSCADAHRLENSGVIAPGLASFEAAQLVVRALEGRPMSEAGPSGGAWR